MAPNRTSESLHSCHYLYWRRPGTYRKAFIASLPNSNDSLNPRLNEAIVGMRLARVYERPPQPVT